MKKHRFGLLICAALLLAAAVVFSAFPAGARAAGEPERVTVVYGGSSWLGHYPAWVGIEMGTFQEEGLGVLFQRFYASSGRMGSLAAGDLDFASTGCISGIALMASGLKDFYAFGTPDSYATVEGIVARKDIKTVQDLKGKKLAVTFASSAHVLALDILEQHGLNPKEDVTLINLKVSEMPAAFMSGEVDACALWTPMFNKLLSMEDSHLLLDDTEFSLFKEYELGPGPDLLVVRKQFVENYPNTTKAFVKGYFKAIELLKEKPEECAEVLVKLTNLSMEEQMAVLKDITWYGLDKQHELMVDPGTFVTGMQKLAEFLVTHNQIDEAPMVKEWVNGDILKIE
ncbi:MAG: ABC transporter substrate-binding protein [Thermodesulfobacteriota bacterium]